MLLDNSWLQCSDREILKYVLAAHNLEDEQLSNVLQNSSIQIQIGVHELQGREIWSLAKQSTHSIL